MPSEISKVRKALSVLYQMQLALPFSMTTLSATGKSVARALPCPPGMALAPSTRAASVHSILSRNGIRESRNGSGAQISKTVRPWKKSRVTSHVPADDPADRRSRCRRRPGCRPAGSETAGRLLGVVEHVVEVDRVGIVQVHRQAEGRNREADVPERPAPAAAGPGSATAPDDDGREQQTSWPGGKRLRSTYGAALLHVVEPGAAAIVSSKPAARGSRSARGDPSSRFRRSA